MLIFHFNKSFSVSAPPIVFGTPRRVIVAHRVEEVRAALDEVARETAQGRYAAGFVGYEAAPAFDHALQVRQHGTQSNTEKTAGALPLLWFAIVDAAEVSHQPPVAGLEMYHLAPWKADVPLTDYRPAIAHIREAIRNGDIYQANYTLRLNSTFSGCAQAWYEDLRRDSGAGSHGRFNAFLDIGTHRILSLSPELFFSWDGHMLRTRPMKGTAKRRPPPATESPAWQRWQAEDAAMAEALLASTKNRAENLMIVDLLRNDVSHVAKPGTVKVPHLFTLETYPTVYQMTSTVTAETREGTTFADVFAALFPCGSITGAPKIKSSEVIADCETTPRDVYCGAIGYISPDNTCVFNVAIRTVVIDAETGSATCGVGGGIVWDSVAEDEYAEALAKAAFMANASQGFELLETLRLENHEYAWLDRHLARLMHTAAELAFDVDHAKVRAALDEHARLHAGETRRVRLTVARDGRVHLTSELLHGPAPVWSRADLSRVQIPAKNIVLAAHPVDRFERALHHKTTRRAVYDTFRQQHPEMFDVLLWNREGELTEFTYGSLVLEIDGAWLTPPSTSGLLPGVLRAELLARSELQERVLTRDDLARASAVWFINSVRGWVPVVQVAP
jgi:para-aminobenzoate synthetase / 4-amino-4-deoxychorismate lyase